MRSVRPAFSFKMSRGRGYRPLARQTLYQVQVPSESILNPKTLLLRSRHGIPQCGSLIIRHDALSHICSPAFAVG
jgi:hypothetical protein